MGLHGEEDMPSTCGQKILCGREGEKLYSSHKKPETINAPALHKNPMPGHLFEGNPVDEDTKRSVTDTPVHRLEKPRSLKCKRATFVHLCFIEEA